MFWNLEFAFNEGTRGAGGPGRSSLVQSPHHMRIIKTVKLSCSNINVFFVIRSGGDTDFSWKGTEKPFFDTLILRRTSHPWNNISIFDRKIVPVVVTKDST